MQRNYLRGLLICLIPCLLAAAFAVRPSKYRLGMAATHPLDLTVVQAPVVALARELVEEAIKAGAISPCDPDAAAYVLVTLKSAYTHSNLLGNELGTTMPTPDELARFCILGLGAADPPRALPTRAPS